MAALYDFHGMAQLAIAGALYSSALPLALAGRIAAPLAANYRSIYGYFPWGEKELGRALLVGGYSKSLVFEGDHVETASLHRAIREQLSSYRPFETMRGDVRLVLIGSAATELAVLSIAFNGTAEPELIVRGLGRGDDSASIELFETMYARDEAAHDRERERVLQMYSTAVSYLTVNCSLAIRNALDRIYDARLLEAKT